MNDKLAILKMVEEGKITVDEAAQLLEALESKQEEFSLSTKVNKQTAKWLRIKVYDPDDKTKVNINVPIALVDIAFKILKSSNSSFDVNLENMNININDIVTMIKEGAEGKLLDLDTEKGEKVEIVVE